MATSLARIALLRAIPEAIEQPGPEGDAARVRVGREAYEINVGQFCCGGFNFGYYYADSPVIAYDGEAAPTYDIYDFGQSTVPGCERRIYGCAMNNLFTTRPGTRLHADTVQSSISAVSVRRQSIEACPSQSWTWTQTRPLHSIQEN